MAQWLTNLTTNQEVADLIPSLAQWIKDRVLLWLWRRPVATALIKPLAWEPPYAAGAALEKTKKKFYDFMPFGTSLSWYFKIYFSGPTLKKRTIETSSH